MPGSYASLLTVIPRLILVSRLHAVDSVIDNVLIVAMDDGHRRITLSLKPSLQVVPASRPWTWLAHA